MKNHDFHNFTASWAGIDIKSGLEAGTPISKARTTEMYTYKTTGSGELIRQRAVDDSGALTCSIDYSSKVHTLLEAQLRLETVATFVLYDGNMKRRWYFTNASLVSDPDVVIGTETTAIQWVWMFEKEDFQPGATNNIDANVVGA